MKNDGRYRESIVEKGFIQIHGLYYDLSHSPVLSEVTFRILLLLGLKEQVGICSLDI